MADVILIIALAFIFYVLGYTAGRMNLIKEFRNIIKKMEDNDI